MKRQRPADAETSLLCIFIFLDVPSLSHAALVAKGWANAVRCLHAQRRADLSSGGEPRPVAVRGAAGYPSGFAYRASTRLPAGHDWPMDATRTIDVYVTKHAAKGWALHAAHPIAPGAYLGEYAGDIVRTGDMDRTSTYIVSVREEASDCVLRTNVDAGRVGNFTRFINHACWPNATLDTYRRSDLRCVLPRLQIRALRQIERDDEITIDYGVASGVGHAVCHCSSANCAGRLPFDASL
ncbi:hypothetical protein SPRG_15023 [Saprolegnia parasitica CBS 223.65]|uniref:SET domain-containing protein n=1 Tax=Saprolegnia parasitica (strain CBS 223.65) TaxID=695850 RepID=A0A067BQQ7_SAPPC|nr:hypothetical protein SPRG_15023 [Saprolegnia parasitica CBS 223.65]KDO19110.1 hypothetical protein SPRG_15023 [Saprolegnia parasitica CBS 223.65]|eukprot:XP_012210182.1 hypothetical protein SPRG_15023 [Saprolegnia parasitica CBS 223.65]